ncbi:histone-lysine N-methyltransferase SETMAR-like [Octopus bimaculoides]|uniref:histone-lysine N-methyltransferase SETMAR-like n=1 Tax=Octopus bimaculoides TaxID=37653 RepID=UPI00071D74C7|nr:histone-lysine N-methyltransferase SETMAR-like [Octopus bimaculoides]|eukprot:XP_014787320.1 PREDICTED: histone-lysine N-methyltransferase SETMAR-like [Octopus bimaculoides]
MESSKKINDVDHSGNVNERVAQNLFRRFKEDDFRFEEKPRSGKPSVVEDEAFLEMIEQQPITSARTLTVEVIPSQRTTNRPCEQWISRISLKTDQWTTSEHLQATAGKSSRDSFLASNSKWK